MSQHAGMVLQRGRSKRCRFHGAETLRVGCSGCARGSSLCALVKDSTINGSNSGDGDDDPIILTMTLSKDSVAALKSVS